MADLAVTLSSPQGTSRPPLALPLKDVVELARKIDRLLAKDFPDVQSIATEVLDSIEEVKDFCDQHYTVLDGSLEAKKIIFDLLREMKFAYDETRAFLNSSNSRKGKASISAWKDSSKIEASLSQLRNRVNKYHTQIMMFAIVGADNQIFVAGQSNARALAAIQQQISSSWVTDDRIVSFLGSNAGALTHLPPSIKTFYVADSYIRMQISTIDEQLSELSSEGSYPVEDPIEAYLLPYQPVIVSHSTEDGATLRQDVIAKIQEIQELVRNDSSTLSIQTGAWEMVNLCTALFSLDMFEEAATMGLWTVSLFRTLVSTDAEVYSPYLSHSLRHLSWFYAKIDNLDGAEKAIEEAGRISRRLYKTGTELELRAQIVPVLTMAAYVASLRGNHGRALEHAEEGVQIFELLIDENKPANSPTDIQLIRTEEEWAEALVNFPDQSICNYSRALQQVSTSLQDNGRIADAVAAQMKATTVMSFISRYYPDGALEPELGDMLYRLSHQDFHDVIPYDEALEYSKQAVEIYRRLSEKNSQRYARPLCNALWEQANILGKLERYDAALGVWKETANLAKDIMSDQLYHANALEQVSWSFRRLKRHDEAAETRSESVKVYHSVLNASSVTEAHAYYDLAVDFQLAERFPEAIEAAEMALTQYRTLAFSEPDKYTKNVAKGLNNLTGILISAKDMDRAFNEGHEALKLYTKLIEEDDSILTDYLRCLSLNSLVSLVSENHTKSLERIVDVLRHSREVVERFPTKPEEDSVLVRAVRNHSQVLSNMSKLDEASVVIQEALQWYEKNPPTHPKPAQQYMECLIDVGSFLDNQGFTEQALVPITKSVEVGRQFQDNSAVASLIVGAMHRRAQLFLELGQFEEGVKASEEAIKLARETTLENIADFIGCLQVQSMAYKYTGRIEEAITVINEAIDLCHGEKLAELTKTRGVLLLHLPQCLQQLSGNIAVAGREADALPIGQEAVDMSLELKGKHVTLPWTEIEPVYMAAQYNLCIRLAANSQLEKALDLVVRCREYSYERSKSRKGILTFYACIVRAEAILFCAAGRHEEGIKARSTLEELMKRLWTEDPNLAKLVEIEVDADKALPSWVELVKTLDLQCHHQDND